MKRILLTAIALVAFASAANATVCLSGATPAGSATLKDAAGTPNTFISPFTDTGDASGNCLPNVILSTKQGEAGTPGTGFTQPTGGTGISGWLSGIYHALANTLTVSGTVTANAGTNLNTSALATSANQATNGATTTHTCSTGGYSELGCLGQIDDDVKATGTIQGNVNVTLTDCSGSITTGGSQQSAFTAQTTLHGFTIANIDASTGSGEDIWFSMTTTAAANTAGSYPLVPIGGTIAGPYTFTAPIGMGTGHAVSVIAATTGHKFSCTYW